MCSVPISSLILKNSGILIDTLHFRVPYSANMDGLVLEKSTQHIRDFKLAIEFKYLMKHAPAGVYLMPEFDNIRRLHGVIFVRRGLYRDGVFRFIMNLPLLYNDENTHPEIVFNPPIFNPLVDPVSGALDLKLDESLKEWQPERHFIVTAVTFLKKIFYMKDYNGFSQVANEDAKTMFEEDKNEFLFRVNSCVRESLDRIYEAQSAECTLAFTEPKPAHDDVIKRIVYQHAQQLRAAGEGGHGNNGTGEREEVDSDAERDEVGMREEPDDDRAAERDDSKLNAFLSSPDASS